MCSKFGNHQRVIRYWVNNIHNEDQQFDLHLWKRDQKINREHLLSNGIHFTKFGNFLAELSKNIEWTLLGLHPINRSDDQQVQSNLSPFFKEGHKKKNVYFKVKESKDIEQTIFVTGVWPWPLTLTYLNIFYCSKTIKHVQIMWIFRHLLRQLFSPMFV